MGVMGAFVFAAQMINFSIPGTGSSGHLAGGLLLAILLGPDAALLVMASILAAQALLFADGGILALGCNLFNMGVLTTQLAFPLLYGRLRGASPGPRRQLMATLVTAEVGLLLGALAVAVETTASGVAALPFRTFLLFMLPIHAAIALVEGGVTSAVLGFLLRARPRAFAPTVADTAPSLGRSALGVIAAAALLTAGGLCWFASERPDGLEWSLARTAGAESPGVAQGATHRWFESLQSKTAWLREYSLPGAERDATRVEAPMARASAWPSAGASTSLAGLVGVGVTLLALVGLGWVLRWFRARPRPIDPT